MLDHISIGVRDVARAKRFYDAALAPLGYTCLSPGESSLGYGKDAAALWVNAAQSPVSPDPQSGLHFCFVAPTRDSVDKFHRAALAAGGRDNGAPGLREDYGPGYYAAFVVDPDGYRLEAYCAGAGAMASVRKEIVVGANPEAVWAAARDVGALHERLVPGFVVATRLEPGARVVTFANGAVVREPIVAIDDDSRRLVWSAQGGRATHYNAALEIFADAGGSRIVWTADFLPDSLAGDIAAAMDKGLAAMKTALAR